MSQVGFIGPGQLGLPMVQRLVGAGHEVTAWARRAEVREDCVARGASAVASGIEAVRGRAVVVVCLFSDAQVQEVLLDGGLLDEVDEGAVVAVHTTGSPRLARALAERGRPRDVAIVDAPVSGTAEDVLAGRLTVMLGGEPADVERVEAVVQAYADPVLRTGGLGSAQLVKLVNNALFTAHLQLAGQAERILAAAGADVATAATAIQRSSGASYAMGIVEQRGSIAPTAEAASGFLHKDVAAVRAVAAELGLDLGVLDRAIAEGPFALRPRERG